MFVHLFLSFEGHWTLWASVINFVMYRPNVRNQFSFLGKSPLTLVAIMIEFDVGLRLIHTLSTHMGFHMAFVGVIALANCATGFAHNFIHSR